MTYDLRNQGPGLGQTYGRLNRLMGSQPTPSCLYWPLFSYWAFLENEFETCTQLLYGYMTSSYPLLVTHQDRKCQMIVKYIAVKCDYSKILKKNNKKTMQF
jgi:hypothetical protein